MMIDGNENKDNNLFYPIIHVNLVFTLTDAITGVYLLAIWREDFDTQFAPQVTVSHGRHLS